MNSKSKRKSVLTMNALVIASLATITVGSQTAFAAIELDAGYQLSAMEASCGAEKDKADTKDKSKEGKCGEGKCGADKAQKAKSEEKVKEGKCGEGKCGSDKKESADKSKEAKCGAAF
jgi:uncharacterized low-complexity protein